jgi:carboxyl-terminal processing protease
MGTKSFGKGSVQTIIPLPQHGAMRLTTARYYTPSGRSIQAVGIEPDIVVEQVRVETLAMQAARREADLRGALRNEDEAPPEEEEAPAERPATEGVQPEARQDFQLDRALDLLRGLALISSRAAK